MKVMCMYICDMCIKTLTYTFLASQTSNNNNT